MPEPAVPTPATADPSGEGANTAPADSLESRLALVQAELAESRRILEAVKQERDLHRALFDAGAVDLDAAAALLRQDLQSAPSPDAADAVQDLRQRKPHLFRRREPAHAPASAMSPAPLADDRAPARRAAEHAAATGDRNALLTYLRLRRAHA